ncbi:hypothetical protein PFISCL1PPCAC_944, partial [Pristionchus fissidentatus]
LLSLQLEMSDDSTGTGDPPPEKPPSDKPAQPAESASCAAKPVPVIPKSLPTAPRDRCPDISFTDSDDPEGDAKPSRSRDATQRPESPKAGPSTDRNQDSSSDEAPVLARASSPFKPLATSSPKVVKIPQLTETVVKKAGTPVVVSMKRPMAQSASRTTSDLYEKYPWLKPTQPSALLQEKSEPTSASSTPGWQQSSLQKQRALGYVQKAAAPSPMWQQNVVPPVRLNATPVARPGTKGGAIPVPKPRALPPPVAGTVPTRGRDHVPSFRDLATPIAVTKIGSPYVQQDAAAATRQAAVAAAAPTRLQLQQGGRPVAGGGTVTVSKPITTPALAVLHNIQKQEQRPIDKLLSKDTSKMSESELAFHKKMVQRRRELDELLEEERAEDEALGRSLATPSSSTPSTSRHTPYTVTSTSRLTSATVPSDSRPIPSTVTTGGSRPLLRVNDDLTKRFMDSASYNESKWKTAKPGVVSDEASTPKASYMLAEMLRTTKKGFKSRGATQLASDALEKVNEKPLFKIKKEFDPFAPPPPEKEKPPRKPIVRKKKVDLATVKSEEGQREGADGENQEKSPMKGSSQEKDKSPVKKTVGGVEGEEGGEENHMDTGDNDFNNDFDDDFGGGGGSDNGGEEEEGDATGNASSSVIDVGSPVKPMIVKREGDKLSPASIKAKAKKDLEEKRAELLKPSLHKMFAEEKEALAKSKAQFEKELIEKMSKDQERLPALPSKSQLQTLKDKPVDLQKAMDRLVESMKSVGSKERLPQGVKGELSKHMNEMMDSMRKEVFLGAVRTEVYEAEGNMFKGAVDQYVKSSSIVKITEEDQKRGAQEAKWRRESVMKHRARREAQREQQRAATVIKVIGVTPKGKLVKRKVKPTFAQLLRRKVSAPETPPGSPPRDSDGEPATPPVSTAGSREPSPFRIPDPTTPPGSPPPPGTEKRNKNVPTKKRLEIQLDESYDNVDEFMAEPDEGEPMLDLHKMEVMRKRQLRQHQSSYRDAMERYNAQVENKGKMIGLPRQMSKKAMEFMYASNYDETPSTNKMENILRVSRNVPSSTIKREMGGFKIVGYASDEFTPVRTRKPDRRRGDPAQQEALFKKAMEQLKNLDDRKMTSISRTEEEAKSIVQSLFAAKSKPAASDDHILEQLDEDIVDLEEADKSTRANEKPIIRPPLMKSTSAVEPDTFIDEGMDDDWGVREEVEEEEEDTQMGRRRSVTAKLSVEPMTEEKMKENIEESGRLFAKMEKSLAREDITDADKDFFIDVVIRKASAILSSMENSLKFDPAMPTLAGPDVAGGDDEDVQLKSKREKSTTPAVPGGSKENEGDEEDEEGRAPGLKASTEKDPDGTAARKSTVDDSGDTVATAKDTVTVDEPSTSKDTVADMERRKIVEKYLKKKEETEKAAANKEIMTRLAQLWKLSLGAPDNIQTVARRPMPTTEIDRARVVLDLREKIVMMQMRKMKKSLEKPPKVFEKEKKGVGIVSSPKKMKPILPIRLVPRPEPTKTIEQKIMEPPKKLGAILLPGMRPKADEPEARVMKLKIPEPEELLEKMRKDREERERQEVDKAERERRSKDDQIMREREEKRNRLKYEAELRRHEATRLAMIKAEKEKKEDDRKRDLRMRQRASLGGVVVGLMEGELLIQRDIDQPSDASAPEKTVVIRRVLSLKEKERRILREFYTYWSERTSKWKDSARQRVVSQPPKSKNYKPIVWRPIRSADLQKGAGRPAKVAEVVEVEHNEEESTERRKEGKKSGKDTVVATKTTVDEQPGTSKDEGIDKPSTSESSPV